MNNFTKRFTGRIGGQQYHLEITSTDLSRTGIIHVMYGDHTVRDAYERTYPRTMTDSQIRTDLRGIAS